MQTDLNHSGIDISFSGSTMITLFFNDHDLTVSNIGDSRAIMGKLTLINNINEWSFISLSNDHKPELPNEKERILKYGGIIEPRNHEGSKAPVRVWIDKNSGISMSRSLGDTNAKKVGVTWQPG